MRNSEFMVLVHLVQLTRRVFMDEKIVIISNEQTLKTDINALRSILNELCCENDGTQMNTETLKVSRELDDLILEYILLKK
jgi:hypothetical protein